MRAWLVLVPSWSQRTGEGKYVSREWSGCDIELGRSRGFWRANLQEAQTVWFLNLDRVQVAKDIRFVAQYPVFGCRPSYTKYHLIMAFGLLVTGAVLHLPPFQSDACLAFSVFSVSSEVRGGEAFFGCSDGWILLPAQDRRRQGTIATRE